MVVYKRFYIFSLVCLLCFIGWLLTLDTLLLSIWIAGLMILSGTYIFTRQALKDVKIKRLSRGNRLEVGNIFDEQIEIRNDSKAKKLWIQVEDQSGILSDVQSRIITNLGAGKLRLYQAKVLIQKRGFYSLGPTRLVSGDPLGIFTISRLIPTENHLTVYPHIEHLTNLSLEPGLESGGQNLTVQTTRTTPQAAGVREYYPGDPLNRIHWPITVKKERLMVKEFDEDTQSCVWLFLDASKGSYLHVSGEIPPALDWNLLPLRNRKVYQLPRDGFEYAVSVTASLADYFTRSQRALGFAAFGRQLTILPAEKGQRQLQKILKILANLEDAGNMPIQVLIERQIKNITRGSALLIITAQKYAEMRVCLDTAARWSLRTRVIRIDRDSFKAGRKGKKEDHAEKRNLIRIAYGDEIAKKLCRS